MERCLGYPGVGVAGVWPIIPLYDADDAFESVRDQVCTRREIADELGISCVDNGPLEDLSDIFAAGVVGRVRFQGDIENSV